MNYFYQPEAALGKHELEDEEFMHCIKVLRKKEGDEIGILDGKGYEYLATIRKVEKRSCQFEINQTIKKEPKGFYHHIAIAPTKSGDRIDWFVEKACELGVDEISFILTKNSERNKLRVDRLEKKAISALKQSKSGLLTQINPLQKFTDFLRSIDPDSEQYIAHVSAGLPYYSSLLTPGKRVVTLIGPEGDFTQDEVEYCEKERFQKTSLGKNTLRTETAALVAGQFVNICNGY